MIEIIGQHNIRGNVNISGSKNTALPIICASLLTNGKVKLINVPNIGDVRNLIKILAYLNVDIQFKDNILKIDSTNIIYRELKTEQVRKIRGSSYLMSVMLALFNKVVMDFPGGCNIGDRSLDFHFEVFKKMGVQIFSSSDISMKCDKFNGCVISFVKKSVGATINALILAGYCSKPVKIYRYSLEPEVIHTIEFLKKIGYRIYFMKDHLLVSYHRPYKKKYIHKIVEDRIETISYALIGLSSKKLKLINVPHKELVSFYECLDQMGANYKIIKNKLILKNSKLNPINIVASTYPAFPTDAQPLLAAILASVEGTSKVEDKIFKDRFNYVNSLKAMGAKIIADNGIIITGTKLSGAVVKGYDLRGVFALIIAAISAKGKTTILDGEIAKRGYEGLINKLIKIGVKIRYI